MTICNNNRSKNITAAAYIIGRMENNHKLASRFFHVIVRIRDGGRHRDFKVRGLLIRQAKSEPALLMHKDN